MVLELNTITESTKDMTAQIEQYQGGLSHLLYLTKGTYKVYDSAMNAQKRVASTPTNQERGEEDRVLAATYEIMNALNNALVATSSKTILVKKIPSGSSMVQAVLRKIREAKEGLQDALLGHCANGFTQDILDLFCEFDKEYTDLMTELRA
ncbi:hypothetical protein AbraCBS73388_003443 [Aspergillus brasiliensis]|uniref:Uncharacterized protein n=1 Tax=Aspergillus brasiliensis TaxID=319629 RepID=A0A9W6DRI2_9EURO|nr:hypothetical protein AbraCBS73388_003443 [Aspergillus brasiliensis]